MLEKQIHYIKSYLMKCQNIKVSQVNYGLLKMIPFVGGIDDKKKDGKNRLWR